MFSPVDLDLERGWPGRIDGDRVIQLAAQTLQSFFTGGGGAREHAEYALDGVVLRAPVLHPPSVRIFDADGDFRFANPAAIVGPEDTVHLPAGVDEIRPVLRDATVIGADGAIGGYTLMNDWVAPDASGAKAHDFAISLGPVVVTDIDEDWGDLVAYAARNTRLLPGDVIAAPGEPRDAVGARRPRRAERAAVRRAPEHRRRMTRVTVVGAGVMGCAAAWALTERGADVTVLEQFELEHTRGSSHGRTRIVRVAYPEPEWVRLAEEAMRGWRELEAQSGEELLGLYGLVEIASSPELTSAAALDACGLGYRLLDGDEARQLGVALPEGWAALHQPEAGVVRADLARRAFLDVAVSRGARVETGRRVSRRTKSTPTSSS